MTTLGNNKTAAATDYTYDVNGNLQKDLNKDIGTGSTNGIVYNYLNLPWQVTVQNKGTLTYIYDAAGNKLEKRTVDNTSSGKTTTTDYIDGYVYENNVLQFFDQEEGRIRPRVNTDGSVTYNYDYFLKDHLGNTRMVLTDEWQQDIYPAATLEDGAVSTEQNYYTINSGDILANPVSLNGSYPNNNGISNPNPNSNTGATSAKMYRLNGQTGDKTGLGITLRVMAGDNISIFGRSFWHNNGTPNNSFPITSVLVGFLNAFAGTSAVAAAEGGTVTGAVLNSSAVTTAAVTGLLNSVPTSSSKPKAYINWILFDEQFRPVTGSSGYDPINDNADQIKTHTATAAITKNGYLYVYCSDESNTDVFFDNLQVVHTRGPLMEETHYYPFGLTMAGISSKAAGKLENKFKFQGQELQHQEFSDGSGLEMYEFKYRFDDPQIGRFWQADPLADKYVYNSTYAFSENKVINAVELEGLESVIVTNTYDKDKNLTGTSTTYYFNQEDYGPLGEGTYTANQQANGTFSENFDPAKGNSVNGFYEDGISQSRWINDKGGFDGYETRLDARLIEKQTEDALVSLGFDEKQVQKDVVVLETDDPAFKGKFAGFINDDVAKKYISSWSSEFPSDPHKSNKAFGSGELGSSGIELKYYDGARSKTDDIPSHLDLVRVGLLHPLDYIEGRWGSHNPGLSNAKKYKQYQEQ